MIDEQNVPTGTNSKSDIVDNILEFLPTETAIEVSLPSKGKFYTNSTGKVSVKPMTFADEKALVAARKTSMDSLNLLLARCVEGIHVEDLLQIDKLFLVLKLREISYGAEYKAVVSCQECSFDNHMTFDLSKLPVTEAPDELTNPIEVDLPVIKKKATVRFPSVNDEKYISNVEIATEQTWRFVESIDGNSDKSVISAVIDKLPLKDMHTIINAMNPDFGLQTKIKYDCQSCNSVNVVDLPITADFFSVN